MIVNANSIVQHCNWNQKWNNKTFQWECKNYRKCKKDDNCNPRTCIYENSKYLKSTPDTSMITYDEIVSAIDIVSTKTTNTIATNVKKMFIATKDIELVPIFCIQFYKRSYYFW